MYFYPQYPNKLLSDLAFEAQPTIICLCSLINHDYTKDFVVCPYSLCAHFYQRCFPYADLLLHYQKPTASFICLSQLDSKRKKIFSMKMKKQQDPSGAYDLG